MKEIIRMYNEELNILESLMDLAEEDGSGERFREYYKEYTKLRDERDYYATYA